TASNDRTARVWDATTGKPLTPPLEHQPPVTGAAFSPNGTRVVTASSSTARVCDATTGKPLTPPLEHQHPGLNAACTANGMRIVTATAEDVKVADTDPDIGATIWDIPLDQGTLAEWSAIAERSPYVLVNGVLVRRPSR